MSDVRRLPVGEGNEEIRLALDELAREGARRMIAAALETTASSRIRPPDRTRAVARSQCEAMRHWPHGLVAISVGHLRRAPDRSTTVRTAVTNVRWSMADSGGYRNSSGPISSIGFAKPRRLRG